MKHTHSNFVQEHSDDLNLSIKIENQDYVEANNNAICEGGTNYGLTPKRDKSKVRASKTISHAPGAKIIIS